MAKVAVDNAGRVLHARHPSPGRLPATSATERSAALGGEVEDRHVGMAGASDDDGDGDGDPHADPSTA